MLDRIASSKVRPVSSLGVSFISQRMRPQPVDIIFTSTPEGVILGYPKDKQVWLKAGDKIVTGIEKLGELEFRLS